MSSELQALLVDPGIVWVGAALPDADIEAILAEDGPAFDDLKKEPGSNSARKETLNSARSNSS